MQVNILVWTLGVKGAAVHFGALTLSHKHYLFKGTKWCC